MMTIYGLAGLIIGCYGLAMLLHIRPAATHPFLKKNLSIGLGILLHSFLLYRLIDIGHTQNLDFFNLFSLIAWLVLLIITISSFKKALNNLIIIALPIAAVSVLLPLIFTQTYMIDTGAAPKMLLHILLSTFAFSVLCIAALQAFLLALQEWLLRHHQSSRIIQLLPPLEIMELLLFRLITVGFVLLTVLLISSMWCFKDFYMAPVLHKLLLSFFAWLVFSFLLLGRWLFGWRGRHAIRVTIIGVTLVTLIYFGSVLI